MAKEMTIKNAEVFGDNSQCLVAKSGSMYVKFTAVVKDDNGNIEHFINCCAFPPQEECVKLRNILVKGRQIVSMTGAYSEREYEKKDGSGTATARDLLCHSLQLGDVVEYSTEGKTTDYSFITKDIENKANASLKKQQASKQAKKPAKTSTSVTMPGMEPEYSASDDSLFADIDL